MLWKYQVQISSLGTGILYQGRIELSLWRHVGSWDITPLFLTVILDGGEWLASHPGHFTPATLCGCFTVLAQKRLMEGKADICTCFTDLICKFRRKYTYLESFPE
jgi:hypothetical protein